MRNRLRELRAARRWSQADLADRLEVSRQTVNAIETGKYDPSLPLAFKIAGVFGAQIATRSPTPTPVAMQAAAARSTRAPSSAYEIRVRPSTTASVSP